MVILRILFVNSVIMDKAPVVKNTLLGLKIYHGLMLALYLCSTCVIGMVLILSINSPMPKYVGMAGTRINNDATLLPSLVIISVILFALLVLFGIAFLTSQKRSKSNWIFQIIVVCLGLGSLLTTVPCVLLLIGLLSPETKAYYLKKS